jgi:hypothetical protein
MVHLRHGGKPVFRCSPPSQFSQSNWTAAPWQSSMPEPGSSCYGCISGLTVAWQVRNKPAQCTLHMPTHVTCTMQMGAVVSSVGRCCSPLAEALQRVHSFHTLKTLLSQAYGTWFTEKWEDGVVLQLSAARHRLLKRAIDHVGGVAAFLQQVRGSPMAHFTGVTWTFVGRNSSNRTFLCW